MFSWICPKCGADVPPSYSECPNCAANERSGEGVEAGAGASAGTVLGPESPASEDSPPVAPLTTAPPSPPPVSRVEPSTAPPSVPPAAAPIPVAPPQPTYQVAGRQGRPGWLVPLFLLLAAGAIAAGIYYFRDFQARQAPLERPKETATVTPSGTSETVGSRAHPLQNHLEATGFRIRETTDKRLELQFVVVNHSAMRIENLGGTVRLRTHGKQGESTPFVSFPFQAGVLEPYGTKELKTALRTNLRAYELPDWQFLEADLEITSP